MRIVWFTTFSMPTVASRNSVNTQNENRFLAYGSLTSNAEVENVMISVCFIVCLQFSMFSGIVAFLFFVQYILWDIGNQYNHR